MINMYLFKLTHGAGMIFVILTSRVSFTHTGQNIQKYFENILKNIKFRIIYQFILRKPGIK